MMLPLLLNLDMFGGSAPVTDFRGRAAQSLSIVWGAAQSVQTVWAADQSLTVIWSAKEGTEV